MFSGHVPLHMACEHRDVALVCQLLDAGAHPNVAYTSRENGDVTPLHVAAQHGHGQVNWNM